MASNKIGVCVGSRHSDDGWMDGVLAGVVVVGDRQFENRLARRHLASVLVS